jgi:hypothetical protein
LKKSDQDRIDELFDEQRQFLFGVSDRIDKEDLQRITTGIAEDTGLDWYDVWSRVCRLARRLR